jgi:hypothetical protein
LCTIKKCVGVFEGEGFKKSPKLGKNEQQSKSTFLLKKDLRDGLLMGIDDLSIYISFLSSLDLSKCNKSLTYVKDEILLHRLLWLLINLSTNQISAVNEIVFFKNINTFISIKTYSYLQLSVAELIGFINKQLLVLESLCPAFVLDKSLLNANLKDLENQDK